jgi:sterol desaturase/sphingolipid hydroxylase (fatty acid hydroxylase superfamily)
MPLMQWLAYWPWLVGYVIASTVVFMWLRKSSSTDEEAAQRLHAAHSFGAQTTLGPIAATFFRMSCPRLLALALAVVWTTRLVVGGWNLWDVAVVLGVLAFWPVQEWVLHVFVLHLKPFTLFGRQIDPIIARNHRNHHRNPWDPALGITPPHIIWLYACGLPGVWLPFLPLPQAITGVAIYFCLVLEYEWIHYLIHTSYVPRSWFYKRLWLNHRLHHFKNEQYWFGVTMLSGDWLLKTQPTADEASRSPTCLTLGVASEDGATDSVVRLRRAA